MDGCSNLSSGIDQQQHFKGTIYRFGNKLSDESAYFLAKAHSINNNNALKVLNLGENKITKEGTTHLAQMIKTNKILTDLLLNGNEINNEGVRILTNEIENHNTSVQVLYLSYNSLLTDSSVDSLLQMIRHNSS